MAFPVATMPDGSTKMSDGTIVPSSKPKGLNFFEVSPMATVARAQANPEESAPVIRQAAENAVSDKLWGFSKELIGQMLSSAMSKGYSKDDAFAMTKNFLDQKKEQKSRASERTDTSGQWKLPMAPTFKLGEESFQHGSVWDSNLNLLKWMGATALNLAPAVWNSIAWTVNTVSDPNAIGDIVSAIKQAPAALENAYIKAGNRDTSTNVNEALKSVSRFASENPDLAIPSFGAKWVSDVASDITDPSFVKKSLPWNLERAKEIQDLADIRALEVWKVPKQTAEQSRDWVIRQMKNTGVANAFDVNDSKVLSNVEKASNSIMESIAKEADDLWVKKVTIENAGQLLESSFKKVWEGIGEMDKKLANAPVMKEDLLDNLRNIQVDDMSIQAKALLDDVINKVDTWVTKYSNLNALRQEIATMFTKMDNVAPATSQVLNQVYDALKTKRMNMLLDNGADPDLLRKYSELVNPVEELIKGMNKNDIARIMSEWKSPMSDRLNAMFGVMWAAGGNFMQAWANAMLFADRGISKSKALRELSHLVERYRGKNAQPAGGSLFKSGKNVIKTWKLYDEEMLQRKLQRAKEWAEAEKQARWMAAKAKLKREAEMKAEAIKKKAEAKKKADAAKLKAKKLEEERLMKEKMERDAKAREFQRIKMQRLKKSTQ